MRSARNVESRGYPRPPDCIIEVVDALGVSNGMHDALCELVETVDSAATDDDVRECAAPC